MGKRRVKNGVDIDSVVYLGRLGLGKRWLKNGVNLDSVAYLGRLEWANGGLRVE